MREQQDKPLYRYESEQPLLTGYGAVLFGNLVARSVVSWSGSDATDLFISRCWEEDYLYPSAGFFEQSSRGGTGQSPVKLLDSVLYLTRAFALGCGHDDLLILTTARSARILHLKFEGMDSRGVPVFSNTGRTG